MPQIKSPMKQCTYCYLQADDLFDDILQNDSFNFDKNFSSELSIKQEPQNLSDAEINALAKDRQKRIITIWVSIIIFLLNYIFKQQLNN